MPPDSHRLPNGYRTSVFLNFPYDEQFQELFLAYVVGVCSFGMTPRTTLEIAGGEQRLQRIASLVQSCRFSFHDLSRVEVTGSDAGVPRFNMPFEAGLALMYSLVTPKTKQHTYFIFETDARRVQKSLSDLGGSDVYAHGGTAQGVLREVSNALVKANRRPTVSQMLEYLQEVQTAFHPIVNNAKATTPYSARVFSDLVVLTKRLVNS